MRPFSDEDWKDYRDKVEERNRWKESIENKWFIQLYATEKYHNNFKLFCAVCSSALDGKDYYSIHRLRNEVMSHALCSETCVTLYILAHP